VVVRHELLQQKIAVIQKLPNLLRYVPRQLPHYYTDLRGGPKQAFQTMSSKTRSTMKRKVRNFEEFCGGELRWRVFRTPDEMRTYLSVACELARKTYQERLFDSGLPDTEEFRRDALALAAQDAVRAFLLFHGEKPIAYLYTPAPDGFLVYNYLGYDPEYATHSPGTVLQYLAFEMLYVEQRYPLYYWGYGYSQTKKVFSTGEVLGADIFYFRPTLRNHAAVRLHYALDRLSERVGMLLDGLSLKRTIRRWLKRT
jgi:CelD/BcsL family acetyltransferase involved in cellulose biosynthesis